MNEHCRAADSVRRSNISPNSRQSNGKDENNFYAFVKWRHSKSAVRPCSVHTTCHTQTYTHSNGDRKHRLAECCALATCDRTIVNLQLPCCSPPTTFPLRSVIYTQHQGHINDPFAPFLCPWLLSFSIWNYAWSCTVYCQRKHHFFRLLSSIPFRCIYIHIVYTDQINW